MEELEGKIADSNLTMTNVKTLIKVGLTCIPTVFTLN